MESAFQYIVAINFGTDLCGYAFIISDDLKKRSRSYQDHCSYLGDC